MSGMCSTSHSAQQGSHLPRAATPRNPCTRATPSHSPPSLTHVLLVVAIPPGEVGRGCGGAVAKLILLAPPLPAALAPAAPLTAIAKAGATLLAVVKAGGTLLAVTKAGATLLAVAKAAAAVSVLPPAAAIIKAAPGPLLTRAPAVALPPPLALLHGHPKGCHIRSSAPRVQPCSGLVPHATRVSRRRSGRRRRAACCPWLLRLHGRLPAPATAAVGWPALCAAAGCCAAAALEIKGSCRRVEPAAEGTRVLRGRGLRARAARIEPTARRASRLILRTAGRSGGAAVVPRPAPCRLSCAVAPAVAAAACWRLVATPTLVPPALRAAAAVLTPLPLRPALPAAAVLTALTPRPVLPAATLAALPLRPVLPAAAILTPLTPRRPFLPAAAVPAPPPVFPATAILPPLTPLPAALLPRSPLPALGRAVEAGALALARAAAAVATVVPGPALGWLCRSIKPAAAALAILLRPPPALAPLVALLAVPPLRPVPPPAFVGAAIPAAPPPWRLLGLLPAWRRGAGGGQVQGGPNHCLLHWLQVGLPLQQVGGWCTGRQQG